MFAKYYLELPYASDAVAAALLAEPPESWLPGHVKAGGEFEESLLAEVGFKVAGRRVARRVAVNVGRPVPLGAGALVVPITWRVASQESLFPTLAADLEVAPVGAELTQMSIGARYDPPLSVAGRLIDRTRLHRVAQAVVRDFTEGIADKLRARLRVSSELVANQVAPK